MGTYNVTDPITGQKVKLTGDSPPTEQELTEVFAKLGSRGQPTDKKDSGFISEAAGAIGKRASNVSQEMTSGGDESLGQSIANAPERALRTAGQAAGAVSDVVGAGAKSLYKTLTPSSVQEGIGNQVKSFAQTETGQAWLNALHSGTVMYDDFKTNHPDIAKDLEASLNIAMLLPIGKGGQIAGGVAKEGASIAKDLSTVAARKSASEIEKKMTVAVTKGMEKGARPGIENMKTAAMSRTYFKNARDAVEKIVTKKGELILTDDAGEKIVGELPKNLKQFSEAIEQTKNKIFTEYNAMAVKAGEKEAVVDVTPIAKELDKVAENKVLKDLAPDVVAYAEKRSAGLAKRGSYSAMEAQEGVAILNNTLKNFYKNPSYETASAAYIDALIVNNMRKSLDGVIEKAVGRGYQELKTSYGSLKAIEKDVSRRANIDARKNVKGLLDFSDVFSGAYAVHGIITMNPAVMGAAGAARGITRLYQHLNNPNRIIKKMFTDTEKFVEKKGLSQYPYTPKSKLFSPKKAATETVAETSAPTGKWKEIGE